MIYLVWYLQFDIFPEQRQTSPDSSLLTDLALDISSSYKIWRWSPLWLADPAVTDQGLVAVKFCWVTNGQIASMPMVWDTFKATMCGTFVAAIGMT